MTSHLLSSVPATDSTLSALRLAWTKQRLPTTPFQTVTFETLIDHIICVSYQQEPDEPQDVQDVVIYTITAGTVRSSVLRTNLHGVMHDVVHLILTGAGARGGTKVLAALRAQDDEGLGWLAGGWTLT